MNPAFGQANTELTDELINALSNLNPNTIPYINSVNQSISSTSSPLFASLSVGTSAIKATLQNDPTATADTVLKMADHSIDLNVLSDSGFKEWQGSGAYYSAVAGVSFTLLRPCTGYVKGQLVSVSAPQTVALTAGEANTIYAEADGILKVSTAMPTSLIHVIMLFRVLCDGVQGIVLNEQQDYQFNILAGEWVYNNIGAIVRGDGANIAVYNTNQLSIDADTIDEHGLSLTIPATNGISVEFWYVNGSGHWARHTTTDTFPCVRNNAGTVEAVSGNNNYVVYPIYAVIGTSTTDMYVPVYIALIQQAVSYTSRKAAISAISQLSVEEPTNEMLKIELVRLGYVVARNPSTVAITDVIISKNSLKIPTDLSHLLLNDLNEGEYFDGGHENLITLKTSASAPTANDDNDDGYKVPTSWIETTNKQPYLCVDNTVGSAVWRKMAWDGIPTLSVSSAGGLTINSKTPSDTQWGYITGFDQALATTSVPQFSKLAINQIHSGGPFVLEINGISFAKNYFQCDAGNNAYHFRLSNSASPKFALRLEGSDDFGVYNDTLSATALTISNSTNNVSVSKSILFPNYGSYIRHNVGNFGAYLSADYDAYGDQFFISHNSYVDVATHAFKVENSIYGTSAIKFQRYDGVANFGEISFNFGEINQSPQTKTSGYFNKDGLTIPSTFKVGIGQSIGTEALEVNGNIKVADTAGHLNLTTTDNHTNVKKIDLMQSDSLGFYLTSDTVGLYANMLTWKCDSYNGGSPTTFNLLNLHPTGRVGINTQAPTEALEVNGNIKYSGSLVAPDATALTGVSITDGTNAFTITTDRAVIQKFGRWHLFEFSIAWSSKNGATGAIYITASDSIFPTFTGESVFIITGNTTKAKLTGKAQISNKKIFIFYEQNSVFNTIAGGDLADSGNFYVSGIAYV